MENTNKSSDQDYSQFKCPLACKIDFDSIIVQYHKFCRFNSYATTKAMIFHLIYILAEYKLVRKSFLKREHTTNSFIAGQLDVAVTPYRSLSF